MDFETIKKKIIQEVAAGVVAKLPEEAKAHIIGEAMKSVIGSYEFKSAVEAKLKAEANARLDAMLRDTKFDKQLCARFQDGVDLFMAALPKVVATAMVGTLVGPRDYKSGAIYQGLCDILGIEHGK